ncbi:MAG: Aerobic glycerol-3-phosphate dehydrogenase [Pseudomonadota bacterium]|jgi:glycerol-3-phosphate dehydrogenase
MTRKSLHQWVQSLPPETTDLLVIGGGATGLGVALQAALEGRGVVLVEARDFACGTSSRSTKLLHGGVRYLAQGHIALVREALRERGTVLRLAPHLAQPLPFVVAEKHGGSWAITSLGLKLYGAMAGRLGLGPTELLSAHTLHQLMPQLPKPFAGVRYWDGQFEDARLALALARSADSAGAHLRNHTRVTHIEPQPEGWRVTLCDGLSGETASVLTRCVVNATGVWIDALRHPSAHAKTPTVRPSQGVHLVVDRQTFPLDQAVLVPKTSDGRVLFALPWLGSTLIGTTDTPRTDAPSDPLATPAELRFLFEQTRISLGIALRPEDVRSIWVGLRPLVNLHPQHASADVSREHLIERDAPGFVSVTGGKWTTYRAMAEAVMQTLVKAGDLPAAPCPAHTDQHRLHGYQAIAPSTGIQQSPGLHLLGSDADSVAQLPGHDRPLGLGLTESIVRHSARHEWAITVEDMLARRWRVLFLDARLAQRMAPRVADILQEETGINPQLDAFMLLSEQYTLNHHGDTL